MNFGNVADIEIYYDDDSKDLFFYTPLREKGKSGLILEDYLYEINMELLEIKK